ncbi:hypothetical protein MVES1_001367 [Malassezia vespertilionis]|uniref:Uncharacterized protein n=1 Tax=Malassezia vespertilionis TaxID=2020962 RepID=A0A2N1JEA8_9BASI|nr:uncharacterized protein MVES1_001367 [Malassezia vespertilionis]PKI84874.1 hypothetical protein MVES_001283 [Malassezia vespertilionis]WFD06029.1 hypothetical protein MVES1_001367 [Malassezia vespertilionis]
MPRATTRRPEEEVDRGGGVGRASLPVVLRKHQKFMVCALRDLAAELHLLHRIWYKTHTQLRHMVWWRPLHRIRVLGKRLVTGPLHGAVPRSGVQLPSEAPTSAVQTLPFAAHVHAPRYLYKIALAYTAMWDAQPTTWESLPRYATPPTQAPRAAAFAAAWEEGQCVAQLAEALGRASMQCCARLDAHLHTPPAPMHAPTAMAVYACVAKIAAVCRSMCEEEHGSRVSLQQLQDVLERCARRV